MAKSKYNEKQLKKKKEEIENWAKRGCTKKEIAANLGISKTTFEAYEKKYSWLSGLIKKAQFEAVEEVENSLYKAATGYYYTEHQVVKVKTDQYREEVRVIEVQKFKPPDTGAMCFYLKNRAKDRWAENPQNIAIQQERLKLDKETAKFKEW